jgi:hypothetical protein
MQDLVAGQVFGSIAMGSVAAVLVVRGARAHRSVRGTAEVFGWNRVQRLGGTLVFALMITAMLALPHASESMRLKTNSDLAFVLLITAALLCGIVDVMNRRVFMNKSHVGAVTLTGAIKQVPWEAVTLVTFHDFYGGFFRLHSARCSIFMPCQIERPLQAIALMEASVPSSALRAAKHGILLVRAYLER